MERNPADGVVDVPDGSRVDVYVAIGSNIEPLQNVRRALSLLRERFGELLVSKAYLNPAVGFAGDDFVNLVVGLRTSRPAGEVVAMLRDIEETCGRPRAAPKWAARQMDLDILLYGDRVADEPGLELPRPDLLRRAYMLRPLAEIAGEVVHPVVRQTIAALWQSFDREAHPLTEIALGE